MSTNDLFTTLLRPAVLHILRAAGFHSAKPSVIDTLVDLTARYLILVASRTAYHAYSSHNDLTPDVTDVRNAMQDCGLLVPTLTGSEEIWKEILRKPLEQYDEETGARTKEEKRRLEEDTQDISEFINWVKGDFNKEISRIAGTLKPALTATEALDQVEMEDYLNTLMKKHSKTGVESRFQGTVLGNPADPHPIKIEGGPVDSIEDWNQRTRERATKKGKDSGDQSNHVKAESQSPDVVMD
jgi:transcription initiation factor TFIID subunit 3